MDIPRKTRKWPRYLKTGGALLLAVAALVLSVTWLRGTLAVDAVSRDEFVLGRVSRGELMRDVRAPGTLVPSDIRWIASNVEGRVERVLAQAGEQVQPHSVLMELSNPTLSRNVDTARIELEVLEAQSLALEKRLVRDLLAQQALVAEIESQYENSLFRMEANRALGDVVSALDMKEWTLQERQFRVRLDIERQRLAHLEDLHAAELRANQAEIQRARRQLQLQEELLEGLTVRAGIEGVLQQVPVEPGQQIASGGLLARVARQDDFKTELRVQESQVQEVALGQAVVITAGTQQARGRVSRIDPAVQNGVVVVDVAFTNGILPGARPDLRVQGLIEIDHVENTLVMPRPVFSQENSPASLFVLTQEGDRAVRIPVSLGLASTDRIQVLSGLHEGDMVIVSDTNRYLERDAIVLLD